MFVDGECRWCRNGFYQDETGQFSCKACPRFQTTENIGSPHSTQCTGGWRQCNLTSEDRTRAVKIGSDFMPYFLISSCDIYLVRT